MCARAQLQTVPFKSNHGYTYVSLLKRRKVQRADLTCDVTSIGSDDLTLDQSATSIQIICRSPWSRDTLFIKLRLYLQSPPKRKKNT